MGVAPFLQAVPIVTKQEGLYDRLVDDGGHKDSSRSVWLGSCLKQQLLSSLFSPSKEANLSSLGGWESDCGGTGAVRQSTRSGNEARALPPVHIPSCHIDLW